MSPRAVPRLVGTEAPGTVVVPRRYNGPRRYGNGGCSAGLIAAHLGGAARVVLRRPVPLDRALQLRLDGLGGIVVTRRRRVVARAGPIEPVVLTPPARPDAAAADRAAERNPWLGVPHALADCFVCSPDRQDGLGVVPGPLEGHPGVLAATLHTHGGLARDGIVRPELLWGALDCPSYPADLFEHGKLALLGTIAVTHRRDVIPGETLVAVGWTTGAGHRSVRTASALLDESGEVVASAENVWVARKASSKDS
jgi:hypothetical protein